MGKGEKGRLYKPWIMVQRKEKGEIDGGRKQREGRFLERTRYNGRKRGERGK